MTKQSNVTLCPCAEHTVSPLSNCLCPTHTHTLKGFLSQLCVTAKHADMALMNPQVKP